MPRIAEDSKSLAADLAGRLARLIAAAKQEGRDAALAEVRSLIGGGGGGAGGAGGAGGSGGSGAGGAGGDAPVARKRGRPLGSKNKPKSDAPPPAAKSGAPRKNPWASLSPADRLARVNAIRKGRGLPEKDSL